MTKAKHFILSGLFALLISISVGMPYATASTINSKQNSEIAIPPQQLISSNVEALRISLEMNRVDLERERLLAEERRERLVIIGAMIGGLAAFLTFILSLFTFIANQNARERERFEAVVQALTSCEADVDPTRRLAAAHALPRYFVARSWYVPWRFPFRIEVANLIAACFKIRAAKSDLCPQLQYQSLPSDKDQRKIDLGLNPNLPRSNESPHEEFFYRALASSITRISASSEKPFAGINFSSSDLRSLDLEGANFANANLSLSYFCNTILNSANLNGAQLFGAVLSGAMLVDARMIGASLRLAIIENASLAEANLTGADLEYAILDWAFLHKATLRNAELNRAYLSHAHLHDANLEGASLTGCSGLDSAEFSDGTVLPDGTKWKPTIDLTKFIIHGKEDGE